jgi:transposase
MSLWSTKLLKHFLYTRCGVEYSRERVRQLLHELGFRQRRLRHRHLRADPEEQAAFVIDLDILLSQWPEDWELLFVDEATVRRHPTLTARWCLVDDVPEVPTGDDHTKIQVYGAMSPLTGRTHYRIRPTLSQGHVADFLKQLSRYYRDKRVLVIHDRARHHQGRVVDEVVNTSEGNLMLMPQPRYSPEFNPQERIWKWMRRVVTHDHWFASLSEEIQAIRDFFCYVAGRKVEVQRLCTIKTPDSLVALL